MSCDHLVIPAPAKLNLFLHVTGRRADGYHTLQTLFQLLDYGDALSVSLRGDGELQLTTPLPGIAADDNLVLRAARALQRASGCPLGAAIGIDKRLPSGGGLGGGSSDAASTLLALNRLWQLDYSLDQLADLGLSLGADVPVFVRGHSAWAEGVGEQLQPVSTAPRWYLVIAPDCHVATAKIFGDKYLTRNTSPLKIAAFFEGGQPVVAPEKLLQTRNDCAPVVRRHYPQVARALDWLNRHSEARLTGTGSCVFAAFTTREQAQAVLDELPTAWRGFIAQGVDHSPAHEALNNTANPTTNA